MYEYLESAKLVASAGRAQLMTAHWLARRPSAGMLACSSTLPLRSAYTSCSGQTASDEAQSVLMVGLFNSQASRLTEWCATLMDYVSSEAISFQPREAESMLYHVCNAQLAWTKWGSYPAYRLSSSAQAVAQTTVRA